MFETESSSTGDRDPAPEAAPEPRPSSGWERLATFCTGFFAGVLAALLPPVLALTTLGEDAAAFPPAPYFLLALGVGLFIGLALLAIGARHK